MPQPTKLKKLRRARQSPDEALAAGAITDEERGKIADMEKLVTEVTAVDDFTPEELSRYYQGFRPEEASRIAAE